MPYYYDLFGWATDVAMPGRATDLEPPADKGGKRANWTGFGWQLQTYVAPPPPAPPVPPVPQSVTMRQARLALLGAGKYAAVDAAINAMPSPQKEAARITWDYASDVERGSDLVVMLGGALGLDDPTMDALFITAATL